MGDVSAENLIPIAINEFIEGISLPVDLFIRLSETKFVQIAKAGTKPSKTQLISYQEKSVQYFWVRREEYSQIVRQNVTLAGLVVTKSNIRLENKTSMISAAARTVFTQVEHMGVSLELFDNARQVTEATLALVESHNDLSKLIESLKSIDDELLVHSMAVSFLSVLIGQSMGWEKKITLEKLALGGLLHDIGLKTLPPELLQKPLAQMDYQESQLYETHAFKGMQMLNSLGTVPDDIVSIVYEHHENHVGQGYPQRLRDVKIHPLAKVVGLADFFCYLTIKNVNQPVPKSAREALMYIEHTIGCPFNKEVFRALKKTIELREVDKAS